MAERLQDRLAIARYFLSDGLDGAYADPERYDRLQEKWFSRRPELARGMAAFLCTVVKPNGAIYEAAAGTGMLSLALVEQGFTLTPTDRQPNMLRHLDKKAKDGGLEGKITTRDTDMNVAFLTEDNSYDGVTQLRANRYIRGRKFYSESYRVLRDGGVLVLPVFTADHLLWKRNAGMRQQTTVPGIARDMQAVGFRNVEAYDVRAFFEEHKVDVPPYYIPSKILVAKK